jgi:hypothetical protein
MVDIPDSEYQKLQSRLKELEAAVGRELKMIELEKEIERLKRGGVKHERSDRRRFEFECRLISSGERGGGKGIQSYRR